MAFIIFYFSAGAVPPIFFSVQGSVFLPEQQDAVIYQKKETTNIFSHLLEHKSPIKPTKKPREPTMRWLRFYHS